MKEVVIRGDVALVRDVRDEVHMPASDLFTQMTKDALVVQGPLPPYCKFAGSNGSQHFYVVEYDPMVIACSFFFRDDEIPPEQENRLAISNHWRGDAEKVSFELGMPYSVFLFNCYGEAIQDIYYGWRPSPVEDITDNIYKAALPNIDASCRVCMGGGFSVSTSERMDENIHNIIQEFFSRNFNSDYGEYAFRVWGAAYEDYCQDEEVGFLEYWEKEAASDPVTFWDSLEVFQNGKSMESRVA